MPAQHWPVRFHQAPKVGAGASGELILILPLECAGIIAYVVLFWRPGPTVRGAAVFTRTSRPIPPGGFT